MKQISRVVFGLMAFHGACSPTDMDEAISDSGLSGAGKPLDSGLNVESNATMMRAASSVYIGDGVVLSNWHVCTSNSAATLFSASETDNGAPYVEGSALCTFGGATPTEVPECERVIVTTQKNGSVPGRIVFAAKDIDLCIVQLDATTVALPSALKLNLTPVRPGQSVTVVGFPGGTVKPVTEQCLVVQEPRLVRDPDQLRPSDSEVPSFGLDCKTVQHGSSGSPVFDDHGYLVGLLWTRECTGSQCEGVTYATAASEWRTRLANGPLSRYSRLDSLLRRFGPPQD